MAVERGEVVPDAGRVPAGAIDHALALGGFQHGHVAGHQRIVLGEKSGPDRRRGKTPIARAAAVSWPVHAESADSDCRAASVFMSRAAALRNAARKSSYSCLPQRPPPRALPSQRAACDEGPQAEQIPIDVGVFVLHAADAAIGETGRLQAVVQGRVVLQRLLAEQLDVLGNPLELSARPIPATPCPA